MGAEVSQILEPELIQERSIEIENFPRTFEGQHEHLKQPFSKIEFLSRLGESIADLMGVIIPEYPDSHTHVSSLVCHVGEETNVWELTNPGMEVPIVADEYRYLLLTRKLLDSGIKIHLFKQALYKGDFDIHQVEKILREGNKDKIAEIPGLKDIDIDKIPYILSEEAHKEDREYVLSTLGDVLTPAIINSLNHALSLEGKQTPVGIEKYDLVPDYKEIVINGVPYTVRYRIDKERSNGNHTGKAYLKHKLILTSSEPKGENSKKENVIILNMDDSKLFEIIRALYPDEWSYKKNRLDLAYMELDGEADKLVVTLPNGLRLLITASNHLAINLQILPQSPHNPTNQQNYRVEIETGTDTDPEYVKTIIEVIKKHLTQGLTHLSHK
ncbi:hypothetical protein KC717_00955 [Candidatus Dojkabacteria bacterium]|uniref:Uncharacterized protein n=1 Tax=Candidatus Dojkabacteria bacterium TaxID=2099670 RepID=A0A955RK90_9BACT|nr:hypothetical protein [Candidatus Dojkabacteria bacterium]